MEISRAQEILDYWFTKDGTGDMDKWFMKSSEYDAEIKEKFGDLLKEAESGKGFGWLVSKDSFVAYIILMDQFSRHIYRGYHVFLFQFNTCHILVSNRLCCLVFVL